jgi:hypothetical protein
MISVAGKPRVGQDFPPPFIVGNPNYPELYPQP